MQRVGIDAATDIKVKGIRGYIERTVTKFGSGAKVDCPMAYLVRKAYMIIIREKE